MWVTMTGRGADASRSTVWQTWPRPSPRLQVLKQVSWSASLVILASCGKKGFFSVTGSPELCDDSHRGVTHEAEVRALTREVMSLWPLWNVLKCIQQQ